MSNIVLCADDYGMNPAVDEGILQLVKMKRLSAFSCMTYSPRWPQAATSITTEIRNQADIGLHLDFTAYNPMLSLPLAKLIIASHLRLLNQNQIKHAIHQQLDHFEESMGVLPDYIDGHQHIHQLPQIRTCLFEVINNRYAVKKPWIRIARTPVYQGLKALLISSLGARRMQSLCQKAGLNTTQYLLGIYGFNEDELGYSERLGAWLNIAKRLPEGYLTAMMCHPATGDKPEDLTDPIHASREIEFKVLNGDVFANITRKLQVNLVRPSINNAFE